MTLNDDTQEQPEDGREIRRRRGLMIAACLAACAILLILIGVAVGVDVFSLLSGETAPPAQRPG